MKKTLVGFLIALLYSTPVITNLAAKDASALFHRLDFAMISDKPGSTVAFRVKPGEKRKTILVCFRASCFRAQSRWQMLATDPNVAGKQTLAIVDDHARWAFRKIHLEGNLWEQAHQKITQLRLPSSVMKNLEGQADHIEENRVEDAKLFSVSGGQAWASQWTLPVQSKVVSEFGSMRVPPNGVPYVHTGVDLRAPAGTPVHVASDGMVIGTDDEVIYGNVVTVDHGFGLMTRYMHLSSFNVNIGDPVKAGDVIGLSGSTGRAEAPHLHWEMRVRGQPVDPLSTRLLLAHLSDLR
jgi:murein DD-endopeptidase MepM/ murein hydrolase activator NlpD